MEHESLRIRSYTSRDLASIYNIATNTLRRHVKPLEPVMDPRIGHYFTPKQVRYIVEHLNKRFKPDLKVAEVIIARGLPMVYPKRNQKCRLCEMRLDGLPISAYTTKDLANIYGITPKTLRKSIQPLDLGPRLGNYFSPKQVGIIVEHMSKRFKPDIKVAEEIVARGHRIAKKKAES